MIGETIKHYRILDKLGGGGMGVVYRAEDTRLSRLVALKFLPPGLTHDEEFKQRFIQEARAASALDHTNICTIHEIDESPDGRIFICMAYYDGETLKRMIARGPLAVDEAVRIARGVAKGLAKAHAEGIVHRDIKPANVIVTSEGIVKIVDFGLAKLVSSPEVTRSGVRAGTVAYMAPEQAAGEHVDQRADIWALGVVLYQMLSGQLPFRGDNEQATIYRIVNDDPDSLHGFHVDIPKPLAGIVARALAKRADERYQRAEALHDDLKALSATAPPSPPPRETIVVLPFKDISPDRDNEYFSDGLTDEIITDLSRVRSLRVISRTSAMRLKGTEKDSRTIGRDLNARYLLEGSVRKVGDDLRITTQLIDARDDLSLWGEKYSGKLADVFDIQERVSRAIVEELQLKLSPEEEERLVERPIDDVQAYECYLRARQDVLLFTEAGLEKALQQLERAQEIVGENSVLVSGQGYVYWSFVNIGARDPEAYLARAEACAARVFEMNPDSAGGHMLHGLVDLTRGRVQDAVRHLKKALAVDPDDPDALFWLTLMYGTVGKTRLATKMAERLLAVDPLTPINHATPGYALLCDGRFDLALEKEKAWHEMEPKLAHSGFWYAWVTAQTGRRDEACELFADVAFRSPDDLWARLGSCFRHALQGDAWAVEPLSSEIASIARWDMQYAWFLAECHALVGQVEPALDWLESATDRGFINYPMIARMDTFLENIRDQERFEEILARVKDAWERFEP